MSAESERKTETIPEWKREEVDEIADNIDVILRRLHADLEKGPLNIDSVYVKTTMGPSVEVA